MGSALEGIQARADRLLSGARHIDDLNKIVLWLRQKSKGSVEEIGHFLAHFEERDRGLATQEMIDFFIQRRLFIQCVRIDPKINNGIEYFSVDDLPPDFAVGLKGRLRIVGVESVAKDCGIPAFLVSLTLSNIIMKAKMVITHPLARVGFR